MEAGFEPRSDFKEALSGTCTQAKGKPGPQLGDPLCPQCHPFPDSPCCPNPPSPPDPCHQNLSLQEQREGAEHICQSHQPANRKGAFSLEGKKARPPGLWCGEPKTLLCYSTRLLSSPVDRRNMEPTHRRQPSTPQIPCRMLL